MARRRAGTSLALALGAAAWTSVVAPDAARAEEDDWSLHRRDDSASLVHQRLAKLRRAPFDHGQWRALIRAIGIARVEGLVEQARASAPADAALTILAARVAMARGDASRALELLEDSAADRGPWSNDVFELRISALLATGQQGAVLAAWRARAAASTGKTAKAALLGGWRAAVTANLVAEALGFARDLAALDPTDVQAQLRVAEAATRAGDAPTAETAFAAALALAPTPRRDAIVVQQAESRLSLGHTAGAGQLLWGLLEDPRRGSRPARQARWDLLTRIHQRAGTSSALAELLDPWVRSHDDELAAWRALARAQSMAGRPAQDAWHRVLALAPGDRDAHLALIHGYENRGDCERALGELRQWLRRHPTDFDHALEVARRWLDGDQRAHGLALGQELQALAAGRPQRLRALVELYNLAEQPGRALAVAELWRRGAPRSPDALIMLGEQLAQMSRIDDALAQWTRLPRVVRPSHRGWARLAELLAEHGIFEEARAALDQALRAAPQELAYLRLRAAFADGHESSAAAFALWQQVWHRAQEVGDERIRDEARHRSVELLIEQSEQFAPTQTAENDARRRFEAGTPLAEAVEAGRFLAEYYGRREQWPQAVTIYQRLAQMAPGSAERLAELAAALRRADRFSEAHATLQRLLEVDPARRARILVELSELALAQGDPQRALAVARDATEASQHQPDPLVRLAERFVAAGALDQALAAYEQALAADPGYQPASLGLARVEILRGNLDRARQVLEPVLERRPDPTALRGEADRLAFDLGEAKGDGLARFEWALEHANADGDLGLERVLDGLDHLSATEFTRWRTELAVPDRVAQGEPSDPLGHLARLLVQGLQREPLRLRTRAARWLGRLGIPGTAPALARAGVEPGLLPGASTSVRAAHETFALTALAAAGELEDPLAVPTLLEVLTQPHAPSALRRVAAWGLIPFANAPAPRAALVGQLHLGVDRELAQLVCIALATHPGEPLPPKLSTILELLTGTSGAANRACALAQAAVLKDTQLSTLADQLHHVDPLRAAIAAWRLGRTSTAQPWIWRELFGAMLGPGGLRRDAAAAALAQLLGESRPPPLLRPSLSLLASGPRWDFEAWLNRALTDAHTHVSAEMVAAHAEALAAAVDAAQRGTRAQRAALRASCGGVALAPGTICLRPLVPTAVPFGGQGRD